MTPGPAFRSSEIRRSMDVFSVDGAQLGTVLWVFPGPEKDDSGSISLAGEPWIRVFDGESIGPAPTQQAGNFGPKTQSPQNTYGATTTSGESLGSGTMLIGRFHGLFGRKWIPLDDVQTVSLERIVLRHPASNYQM